MLYDLIFGKGIEGGGKIKRELKKHEDSLKNELKKIMRKQGGIEALGASSRRFEECRSYAKIRKGQHVERHIL